MMKSLLVGGPKNGTVLYIKAGISVLTEHEGKRYEYQRKIFAWYGDKIDAVWPVWLHGDGPDAEEVLSMIQKAEIVPIGKATELASDQIVILNIPAAVRSIDLTGMEKLF
ncbi:hypothetical protein CAP31_03765 [Sulfuriferula sp. AH1]|uniref:hypothetical protein n=1 Tax=Sulfuriferula sp. AH1 TaxID=1985873 RepID=UPI000B3B7761|nr:hypothetical protein [Sulfuriferula sp. AH1]ARU30879.1 hypothetical protein CAP31_03765 [Sulfuriferula sp. AH1]